ncbi:MAG: LysM peptidoglycan-binding domain-containing protein [Caldilineaceae bacterium]
MTNPDVSLLFVIILLAITIPAFAVKPVLAQDSSSVLSQISPDAQVVALAINQMRAQAGLPPLALHPLLNLAAQNHVNDMIGNNNYSHTGSDGSNVRQRVARTGYGNSPWASENWVSVSDPSQAIQWWMNSTVHRNNILNHNWHEYGIGTGRAPNGQIIFVAVFSAGENSDGAEIVMPPPPEPLPIPAGGINYTVQPGDTLLAIGIRYGVEWPIIAAANGLTEFSMLQIGQVLRLPGVGGVGGPTANTVRAANDTVAADVADGSVRLYTVQPGNTLADIATIYGLSWQQLAAANGLGEYSVLSVGQELRIPKPLEQSSAPTESSATAPSPLAYHEVVSGDTIISIALLYGIDWQQLLAMNNLTESSVLSLGQKIRIR